MSMHNEGSEGPSNPLSVAEAQAALNAAIEGTGSSMGDAAAYAAAAKLKAATQAALTPKQREEQLANAAARAEMEVRVAQQGENTLAANKGAYDEFMSNVVSKFEIIIDFNARESWKDGFKDALNSFILAHTGNNSKTAKASSIGSSFAKFFSTHRNRFTKTPYTEDRKTAATIIAENAFKDLTDTLTSARQLKYVVVLLGINTLSIYDWQRNTNTWILERKKLYAMYEKLKEIYKDIFNKAYCELDEGKRSSLVTYVNALKIDYILGPLIFKDPKLTICPPRQEAGRRRTGRLRSSYRSQHGRRQLRRASQRKTHRVRRNR